MVRHTRGVPNGNRTRPGGLEALPRGCGEVRICAGSPNRRFAAARIRCATDMRGRGIGDRGVCRPRVGRSCDEPPPERDDTRRSRGPPSAGEACGERAVRGGCHGCRRAGGGLLVPSALGAAGDTGGTGVCCPPPRSTSRVCRRACGPDARSCSACRTSASDWRRRTAPPPHVVPPARGTAPAQGLEGRDRSVWTGREWPHSRAGARESPTRPRPTRGASCRRDRSSCRARWW